MKLFDRFKKTETERRSPLKLLLLAFEYALVFVYMLFKEPYGWLKTRVYRGRHSFWRSVTGFVLGIGGMIQTAHWVGWSLDYGWYLWVPAAILGYFAVFGYAWPLLYLCVIHPVQRLLNWLWGQAEQFIEAHFSKIVESIVKVISKICIGSGKAWRRVRERAEDGLWLTDLLTALCAIAAVVGTAFAGWKVYAALHGLIGLGLVGIVIGAVAGLALIGLVCALVFQMLEVGKVNLVALAVSGVGTYALQALLNDYLQGWQFYAALIVAFIISVGYVFPLAVLVLTDKFLVRIWQALVKSIETTYDESNRDYRRLVHHVANLLATGAVAYGAFGVGTAVDMPFGIVAAATALLTLVSYQWIFKLLNGSGGNATIGGTIAVASGICAGMQYRQAGWVFGIVGAIVVGIIDTLVVAFVVVPVVYVSLRKIALHLPYMTIGNKLQQIYAAASERCRRFTNTVNELCQSAYGDESGYQELFVHMVNIAVAVLAAVGLFGMSSIFGLTGLAALTIKIILPILSYLCVGRLLIKSEAGTIWISAVVSLIAGYFSWTSLHGSDPSFVFYAVKTALVITATAIVFLMIMPATYLLLQLATGPALVGQLKPLLCKVHDYCWARFMDVIDLFVKVYEKLLVPVRKLVSFIFDSLETAYNCLLKYVLKPFFQLLGRALTAVRDWLRPVFAKIAAAWTALREAYKRLMAIFQRKRS